MSYCRFGWDGSDVYVYTSTRGIECCFCVLQEREWVDDPGHKWTGGYFRNTGEEIETVFRSNAGMIEHLLLHRLLGHTVPEYALERLRDPKDAEENEQHWREHQ